MLLASLGWQCAAEFCCPGCCACNFDGKVYNRMGNAACVVNRKINNRIVGNHCRSDTLQHHEYNVDVQDAHWQHSTRTWQLAGRERHVTLVYRLQSLKICCRPTAGCCMSALQVDRLFSVWHVANWCNIICHGTRPIQCIGNPGFAGWHQSESCDLRAVQSPDDFQKALNHKKECHSYSSMSDIAGRSKAAVLTWE